MKPAPKPKNVPAKELSEPKYRQRIVPSKKRYRRKKRVEKEAA